jgi:hypothetical protein
LARCTKRETTVLPVCGARSEKFDVVFAAKALPVQRGALRVGGAEQLDGIVYIWRLIAVSV